MLINNIQKTIRGDRARISATYIWEDCDRPETEVYIETAAEFAEDLAPNANAFLLGGTMPAMVHGERRVCIEGQVCPELRNGLVTAVQLLQLWHGKKGCRPIAIEATQGFVPDIPRTPARTASRHYQSAIRSGPHYKSTFSEQRNLAPGARLGTRRLG